ncbi:MAG: histidine triad nucleotide-binding protein [Actinobacteria bacterium HGW-Actinobacteria-9]|jgi:histidine triad (HIT) family protein|nr:MAG: histidine triad nucleotide-binding protein [Actinobacteria bacterium HGW-Actinobacteria-9]
MVADGSIPTTALYEDEYVIAFDDISPQAPVHSLVIPKQHFADLGDDVPPHVAAALMAAIPHVARVKGIDDSGYRVIINKGRDANQTVNHLHIHVIGGQRMTHGMVDFDAE